MSASSSVYRLVVTSPRGGAAATTTALALAWCAARAGATVGLVDASADRAASRLIGAGDFAERAERAGSSSVVGATIWPRVAIARGDAEPATWPDEAKGKRLVIVDAPRLGSDATRRFLRAADGTLVTCVADPGSIRATLEAAEELAAARRENPRLELHGWLLAAWDSRDPIQVQGRDAFERQFGPLFRDPPAPFQRTLFEWPLAIAGGAPDGLPAGPALDVYGRVFDRLRRRVA